MRARHRRTGSSRLARVGAGALLVLAAVAVPGGIAWGAGLAIPVAVADVTATAPGVPTTVFVLDNDTGLDDVPIVVTAPALSLGGGTVVVGDGGADITYTPPASFHGVDHVTYTVTDVDLDASSADIAITVNDTPFANDDVARSAAGAVTVAVLANDEGLADGPLSLVVPGDLQGAPLHGTAVVQAGNTVLYTPEAGFTGLDRFTYTVKDVDNEVASASVDVRVGNEIPAVVDDAISTSPGSAVVIDVLGNDTGIADTPITLSPTETANGVILVNPDATLTYTPNTGFTGTDTFTYTATDVDGDQSPTFATVTVQVVNQVPVAVSDVTGAKVGVAVTIPVTRNDTGIGDGVFVSAITQPLHGSVPAIDATPVTELVYTPVAGYIGPDSFTYQLTDSNNDSSGVATVSINVMGTVDMNQGSTATTLAAALVGSGVTVNSATYAGASNAGGTAQGVDPLIPGFSSAVVLGSGDIATVAGPNDSDGATSSNGTPGDSALDVLAGTRPTFDASVLDIDFTPAGNTVSFDYVFGSEEYNEYANTDFNDVFGFFINGVNCATVGASPVSINTINGGNPVGTAAQNSGLFRDNDADDVDPRIPTQLDGLTTKLTCTAAVNPGVLNHMKLAIADASDSALDSFVLLAAGTFSAQQSISTTITPDSATSDPGTTNGYTVRVTNPNDASVGVTSFTVTLPAGFSYLPGTASGATTADPTQVGQVLTFTTPNATIPALGFLEQKLGVKVTDVPGGYTALATADAPGFFVVGSGPSATITVLAPPLPPSPPPPSPPPPSPPPVSDTPTASIAPNVPPAPAPGSPAPSPTAAPTLAPSPAPAPTARPSVPATPAPTRQASPTPTKVAPTPAAAPTPSHVPPRPRTVTTIPRALPFVPDAPPQQNSGPSPAAGPTPAPSPLSGTTDGAASAGTAATATSLSIATVSALPGGSSRITGRCAGGSSVTLTVDGEQAGTATPSADGSFTTVVDVPDLQVGRHLASASCGGRLATADLDLVVGTSATGTTPALAATAGIVLIFFVLLAGMVIPTGDSGPRRRPIVDDDEDD